MNVARIVIRNRNKRLASSFQGIRQLSAERRLDWIHFKNFPVIGDFYNNLKRCNVDLNTYRSYKASKRRKRKATRR